MQKSYRTVLFAILGPLVAIVAIRFFFSGHRAESPSELAELALRAGSQGDQEQAATRLEALAGKARGTGPRNAAQPFLARLLNESDNPGVRSSAMRGLAAIWDYQYVPKVLQFLDDSSPQVRSTAAQALARLLSVDPRFDANASTEHRAASTKRLHDLWDTFAAGRLKSWQRELEEKDVKIIKLGG